MGMLFILFAVAMAMATFIENDFGSAYAYSKVYDTWWFELILILMAVNLAGQMISQKLYRRNKLPVFIFHLSFIVMIIGAGITRYFGWEGIMHIREGESQNTSYSVEKYLGYKVTDISGKLVSENSEVYSMAAGDNFKETIETGGKEYELVLARIIPNATETVSDSQSGEPVISLLMSSGMSSRENVILKRGEVKNAHGLSVGFDSESAADVNITSDSSFFILSSDKAVSEVSMMTGQSRPVESGAPVVLKTMQILMIDDIRIVPQTMSFSGTRKIVAVDPGEQNTGMNAFIFHVFSGTQSGIVSLWDNSQAADSGSCVLDGNTFYFSYGSKPIVLPFGIKLNDFVLERYPGSASPSGYRSKVTLVDKDKNLERPYEIYMNNILKHQGYRFYQSSYDQDEKGTILSVNRDRLGMFVTYAGYGLLILFIILSLVMKNSSFRKLTASHWNSNIRKISAIFILLVVISFSVNNSLTAQKLVPDQEASSEFGKVLVQDQKGRTKPLFTLSNDILRKVTRENKFQNLTSMQVFLGIHFDFDNWKDVPLIKVSNTDLQRSIGITGDMASFTDLVDIEGKGAYKLSDPVNKAYAKAPGERTKMDKEVMKVDERVNIVYMIYKGDFLKLFPLKDGTDSWGSSEEALNKAISSEDSLYLKNLMPILAQAFETGNMAEVRLYAGSISDYQARFSAYELPSKAKINAELLYYRIKIFERLFPFYSAIGMIMLVVLIIMVIRGTKVKSLLVTVLSWLLFGGFILHTLGFALRWYISGHSPMSNGYESMIFISWVTLLAGFIFSRKSSFALSATAVLASMTLMVAHLSFMDPEITNLVPVLKSYWLTLHVSVITGSYGFLGLGALLGLISLILLVLSNDENRNRISDTIDELTVINFKTLTLGLYFLTIGTFLGAIWANESWGRYWGWDPKETWSLITIIVYSFVVHSRSIPGLRDIYTFNLLALFAFASVLMTYFGVNYYLSGLHSYASGDPVPVPNFVYVTLVLLIGLSVAAYMKYNLKKADHK